MAMIINAHSLVAMHCKCLVGTNVQKLPRRITLLESFGCRVLSSGSDRAEEQIAEYVARSSQQVRW